ncbi:MAG TPA: PIG-L family deacetylase, partial [Dehalococcoidia bacterium]|nr:PIG-L family deacetylase [Dehalococcoidia bacterium]
MSFGGPARCGGLCGFPSEGGQDFDEPEDQANKRVMDVAKRRQGRVRSRLIISTHLDDAALSVWHRIAEGGATVVTVFAGVPDEGRAASAWDRASGAGNSAELMRQRRAEDAKVLEANGAQVVHLDFLDEQYRDGPPSCEAIINALSEMAPHYDEISLPAGMGGHSDHQIVAEAALAATVGRPRVMYADLPYAARDWSRVLASSLDELAKVKAWTKALLHTCPLAPQRAPMVRRLDERESKAKHAALAQYGSQMPLLIQTFPEWWNNPELFNQEWFWDLPPTAREAVPFFQLPARPQQDPMTEARERQQVFLSIIMRTQGTRPQLLSEALGSLVGQTSHDFEVLLVAHDVAEANLAIVRD